MASTIPSERHLRRVIGDGSSIPDGEVEGVGEQELLDLYRSMVLLRTYDERSVVYHSQGRIGTYAIYWGHEAIQAGAVHALEDEDWIFPSYRESAIGLLPGVPAAAVLWWWRGHPSGWWNPADYNVASICVPIATQVPHAAGLAWGKRLRGESACALTFFGDGATSEGAFHEGANFAAVMRAPLVLLCNNNQWAISTHVSAQTKAHALVDKAAGYGIPGVRVDGGDVLAVYEATREAVARGRAGEGPSFIEALTYRSAPHATADDPKAYIDAERVEEGRANECLGRFEGYLRRQGVLHDDLEQAILAMGPETVCMVHMEPVQNAGGCFTPPEGYWQGVREICDRYDVLLSADEVITGFGRLGYWFGSERYDIRPDIVTSAKGLSSSYAAIGAVVATDRVMEPFTGETSMFAHGITFGGHPTMCAIALKNIEIMKRERILEHVRENEAAFRSTLEQLLDLPIVGDVRGAGYFLAIELVKDKDTRETFSDEECEKLLRGYLSNALFDAGMICRADDRGDPVVQISPPLVAGQAEFDEMTGILGEVLTGAVELMRP